MHKLVIRIRVMLLVSVVCLTVLPVGLHASNAYIVRNLVSDLPGLADFTDPNLKGAWGISESSSSPFWISDAATGVSTLYTSTGSLIPLVVTIPPAAGGSAGIPTGTVYNSTTGFTVASGEPAAFIFDTLDGTVSGWNPTVNQSKAILMVDNSTKGAAYSGLAIGAVGANTYLYAANMSGGTIDVFDSTYAPVTLLNAFQDSQIPAGYAPFNVQNLGGNLYVTYAQQNADKTFIVPGAGSGYVDVYSTAGALLHHLVSGGNLNAPWGVAIAPANFGDFANDLLVGNFGDGNINAYNPTTGAFVATLNDAYGTPIVVPSLWALQQGNGGSGGDANAIYFTAGLPGPDGGPHGLLGRLQAAPVITSAGVLNGASFQSAIAPNTWVTIKGSNLAGTTREWESSDIVNGALPTDLDGVSVSLNGMWAYVEYVSPTQLNVLLPVGLASGTANLQTFAFGLSGPVVPVQVLDTAPAFFMQSDGKHVVATHADGTLIAPAGTAGATPAAPGETIVMYGTGFGVTNPAAPEGMVITTPLPLAAGFPTITFNGAAGQVRYSSLTYAGLFQINVTIPTSAPSGDVAVVAQVGPESSPANVVIAIQ
ncbi:MAG TPA: TIGR03118 family protein [Bryobacteraceae bacterium]|nr:TIGR03118 family protein [Bryobacteraceae bacterium]